MKKAFVICVSVCLIISIMSVNVFAKEHNIITEEEKRTVAMTVIDEFNKLYEKYNGKTEEAIDELVKGSTALKLVANTKTTYEVIDGEAVLYKVTENGKETYSISSKVSEIVPNSQMSWMHFTDSIVWDGDWNTYVYLGSWDWNPAPDEAYLLPWDCIGFYTQDIDELRTQEYILRGYNSNGASKIYYNTDSGSSSGPVSKGTDNLWGVAFWHDESVVDNGTLSAPLYWTSGSTAKVMMKYGHGWTQTYVTGLGGDASITGGGFSISWDREVSHWPDVATSYGVRLP